MSKKHINILTGMLVVVLLFTSVGAVFSTGGQEEGDKASQVSGQPMVYKTTGPAGNEPVDFSQVKLMDDDASKAKEQKLKIAVLMHTSSDFTNAVISGVKDTAEKLEAKVVLVTDAEFDANKQKTDIENALVLNPDIIITLILDSVSGAAALRPAIEKGVKVVLLSNLPKDFVYEKDYVSIVTDDLYNMGKSVAELIGDSLGGKGKVGLIFHDANYYVTNQRDRAVKTVLTQKYSDIEIVAERGIANPSDGEVIASAMLTQFPDIQAIYTPWDTIAEGALAAVRSSDKKNVKVFTIDLGATTALDMAKKGNMSGIVADLPYELGATLTNVGVMSTLGKKVPPFITVPAIKVRRENLEDAWMKALKREIPVEVKRALDK